MYRNKLNNAIYVGDTKSDYKASIDNNIPFIFVTYGFGVVDNPNYRINNFKDLLKLC